ncbi:substrate-binding domain-containing protein [Rugosimonospora africana]|uniref:Rhamnose ABC transporter substrate-binding protein n=1 Tax=Rugosimonospora africana TaxID=556532 RepID=A0A8J3VTT5_9ACTN|nr:substrate-binding domain-containing protein [Rugosimonospora africana]GIH18026.1 rhamnose ABC transporter substrate-binding protein [Rugosimonospora africana]
MSMRQASGFTTRARFGAAVLAAAAVVSVSACSSGSNAGGTSGGSVAKVKSGDPITVAIVPKLLGLSVFEANVKGAKQVAPSLKVTVNYTASVQASGPDQANIINGLVKSNNPPNVIAYSANDPTSEVPALMAAKAAGIKVIGFDSDVTATARDYFIQDTGYPEMGKALIDAVVQKFGDSGTIGILSSTKDATIQNAWIDAMQSYIKSSYPKLKVGPIGYGQSNQATSQTQATNLINSNPDLKALIPIDGAAVPGALAAVKAIGKAGKIGVFGIGDPNPNKQYFEDGSLTGLFLWDEVKQGQLIAYVARKVADGTMPAAGGTFTAGDLGSFTVSDDPAPGTIIFSKPLEFTKDNYKQYDF